MKCDCGHEQYAHGSVGCSVEEVIPGSNGNLKRCRCTAFTETGALDLAALEAYLASCVRRRDWHGVSDAANDIRVLEAKLGR